MSDDTIDELLGIMERTGDYAVTRAFAQLLAESTDPKAERAKEALAQADQRRVFAQDNRTKLDEIAALTPDQRETMARLALAGYRFIRGMFYWRVISPDNFTVDALQPELARAISATHFHNEERTNGYPHK